MDRRGFFMNSVLAGAGATTAFTRNEGVLHAAATMQVPLETSALSDIPVFCAHEHWGSIDAVGMTAEGFRADAEAGAEPGREASLWDILLDPYFGGWLFQAGWDARGRARAKGFDSMIDWWRAQPVEALTDIQTPLRQQSCTGAFQCIRHGVTALHGADISDMEADAWRQADASVGKAYKDIFGWYKTAMRRMNVSELIRPVHPEYFLNAGPRAEEERAFTHPILRIDPLLELWPENCPRRDRLAEAIGVEPRDAASWRAFISALFDRAAEKGNVGVKQLQAYTRPLDFAYREDGEVTFRGPLRHEEARIFQDWIMHECCKQAHERRWPHQAHTGTHNLPQSSPLPLAALASRYPNMNLVLLHCWPFLEEAGFLAKHTRNIYLDACWQTVLNPAFFEQALSLWLGYLPVSKVMCSQDATSVEMAAGSIMIARRLLEQALTIRGNDWQLPEPALRAGAADILHNNAVNVYGIGAFYSS